MDKDQFYRTGECERRLAPNVGRSWMNTASQGRSSVETRESSMGEVAISGAVSLLVGLDLGTKDESQTPALLLCGCLIWGVLVLLRKTWKNPAKASQRGMENRRSTTGNGNDAAPAAMHLPLSAARLECALVLSFGLILEGSLPWA